MTTNNEAVIAGWLSTTILLLVFTLVIVFRIGHLEDKITGATIGGTTVPAVHCQEDEVISWLEPDRLGCVHYEEVK